MGTAKGKRAGLPYRDELPTVSVCPLKASGALTPDIASVEVFGCLVKVRHLLFPVRGKDGRRGSRSYFICPSCDNLAVKLRLLQGRIVCGRCDGGLIYRCQNHDPTTRIAQLRLKLYGSKPVKQKRARLEQLLRRALITVRQERLNRVD